MRVVRLITFLLVSGVLAAQDWSFAVSGDSRNCGDVVMPSIAAGVHADGAKFYWHLGDFRALYDFDQDMMVAPGGAAKKLTIADYQDTAWPDFIANQLQPFGKTPVFLAMGNHETYAFKTRTDYVSQFADWINSSAIQQQRLKDDPADHLVKTYYHWIEGGVDFITLDNASLDQFSSKQLKWFEAVLKRAETDSQVHTVIVGMHAALPDSLAAGHSMNDWPLGEQSGRRVYSDLLQFQKRTQKNVYALASHSHFYMEGIFDSDYWHANGGVLPGWIIGTAGAVRYRLPATASKAKAAETDVYGYMVATVHSDGKVDFTFKKILETEVRPEVTQRLGAEVVHTCFAENRTKEPAPH